MPNPWTAITCCMLHPCQMGFATGSLPLTDAFPVSFQPSLSILLLNHESFRWASLWKSRWLETPATATTPHSAPPSLLFHWNISNIYLVSQLLSAEVLAFKATAHLIKHLFLLEQYIWGCSMVSKSKQTSGAGARAAGSWDDGHATQSLFSSRSSRPDVVCHDGFPHELLDLHLQQCQYALHHGHLHQDPEESIWEGAHDCRKVNAAPCIPTWSVEAQTTMKVLPTVGLMLGKISRHLAWLELSLWPGIYLPVAVFLFSVVLEDWTQGCCRFWSSALSQS